MSAVLQVADQKLGVEEICALLTSPQVLPHLLRELIVEQVTATVDCRTEELEAAFREMAQLPQYQSLPPAHVERLIPRQLKLEKFKVAHWAAMVEAEFLQHQERYDQVLFSLIQTDNLEVIQELYFRLREGEANFGEIASQYSHGPEARTNGLVGPLELYNLHPKLSHMLRISQPGQVSPPFRVDQWVVIVRLERYLPAQFDEKLRQRLVDEKFEEWMQQAIAQHAGNVRIPDMLDLPTIDLQEQAELKLPPSPPPRRRLAAAPPPPANPKLKAANVPAPQSEPAPVTAKPIPNPRAKISPFADERLLDAPATASDPSPVPSPANGAIAFTAPSRLGVGLPKVNLPKVNLPVFQMPPLRGTLLLALLPLLLLGWLVAALLGWDARVQALFSSPEAPPEAPTDLTNTDLAKADAVNPDLAHSAAAPEAEPGDEPLPNAPAAEETSAETEAATTEPNATGDHAAANNPAEDSEAAGELATAEREASEASEATAAEISPNLLPDDVATPFHTAVNHANQAVALIPKAANPTDWQRIAQEWQAAVQLMAIVPADHPQAELAQTKVREYQGYLDYAQTQSQNPDHAFRVAVRHAEEAAQSSQDARRTQDWDRVIEGWEDAIAAMKAVPVESEHYSLAQAKVLEYQGYREAIEAIAAGRSLATMSQ
ncbi:MAG: peptidylprolyl isomerase [Cyanobacteria bacterium P01_G01_bin.54]